MAVDVCGKQLEHGLTVISTMAMGSDVRIVSANAVVSKQI